MASPADREKTLSAIDKMEQLAEEKVNAQNKSGEPTPEEAKALARRQEKKARLTQALTRGVLGDRLQSVYDAGVPDGYRGKFVRDDEESIIRYSNLGYVFTYKKGGKAAPDGRIRVGDVVLMTISEEDRELLAEVKQEQVRKKLTAARREYLGTASEKEVAGVKSFDESITAIERS